MTEQALAAMTLRMELNGSPVSVEVDASEPLAFTLRNRLRLTGTKVSCDVQACGACTVLVDGVPRSSCTFLAYEARDRRVTTIEGLTLPDGTLHPLQQAFIDANAFQCGFCTSGMILSAWSILADDPDVPDEDLIEAMNGNLCRCTGYLPIVAALVDARQAMRAEGQNSRAPLADGGH